MGHYGRSPCSGAMDGIDLDKILKHSIRAEPPQKSPPPPALAEEGLESAGARPAKTGDGQNLTVTTECLGITSTAPSATAFFSDLGPLPS